ncbi:MAG: hypothetical protein CL790_00160 [Chloroflexi bacterium]|nr:hypothetical protein [Chloroflexota bacterium]
MDIGHVNKPDRVWHQQSKGRVSALMLPARSVIDGIGEVRMLVEIPDARWCDEHPVAVSGNAEAGSG